MFFLANSVMDVHKSIFARYDSEITVRLHVQGTCTMNAGHSSLSSLSRAYYSDNLNCLQGYNEFLMIILESAIRNFFVARDV